MFALYGTPLAHASAAVLAYRLFQLGLPVLCGLPGMAYLAHRRRAQRDPDAVATQFAHLLAPPAPPATDLATTTTTKES